MSCPHADPGGCDAGHGRRRRLRIVRTPAITALLLSSLAAATALAAPRTGHELRTARPGNPIQAENTLPGTRAWYGTPAPPNAVDAYASEVSARPGQPIHLHVATEPAAAYRIEIYRLGWYGGTGGRLIGCSPSCNGSRQGVPRPNPGPDSGSGLLKLDWPVTDTIKLGRDWVSGYYYVNVVLANGASLGTVRHVPIVVLAGRNRPSEILAQAPVNTWQAYNAWGGMSLYTKPGTLEGSHVSFDRPYDIVHQGPGNWELSAVRFLERNGYDVSYTTDLDTDRDPASLLRHALVMTLGHDEYWTHAMRDAFEAARDAGVNLAFLGANTGYWQIRYEDGRRTLVEYRHPELDPERDPSLKTTTFRELTPPRPECTLLGVAYGQLGDSNDYTVNADALSDPWFKSTGFTPGSTLHGLVGYEWDGLQPGCDVPPVTVFFHSEHEHGTPPVEGTLWNADAVRYTAPSGARVFAAGSFQFTWGLDPVQERYDARLDRFMRNGLDDLTRPAAPASVATTARAGAGVFVAVPAPRSVQVTGIIAFRHRGPRAFAPGGQGVVKISLPRCTALVDRPGRGVFRYAVAYVSRWRASVPTLGPAVRSQAAGAAQRTPCARPLP
jgi:hypothetical protein